MMLEDLVGKRCVVAIDGPSGTGKSTVSRRLATAIGGRYLDTGAMYRAVTWAVLTSGIDPSDRDAVASLVEKVSVESGTDPVAPSMSVDGRPVDLEIRTPEVTAAVSAVAAVPEVRTALVARQREIIAHTQRIVVEGRDIGAVVAPDAELKVYLTASEAERARRRSTENAGGVAATADQLAATQADLARRDQADSTRAADPLRRTDDAIELDTTGLGIDAVVEAILRLLPANVTHAAGGTAEDAPGATA
jgi:CMP/dCMP kinase